MKKYKVIHFCCDSYLFLPFHAFKALYLCFNSNFQTILCADSMNVQKKGGNPLDKKIVLLREVFRLDGFYL